MFSRRAIAIIGLVTSFGLPAGANPRPIGSTDDSYRVTHWGSGDNGLPQNSAKVIVQSREGYLWVGTLNGLARFDGFWFTVFDHENTPALTSDAIDALAVDATDDSIWIQARDRLIHFANNSFEVVAPSTEFKQLRSSIWAAPGGGVWCSEGFGTVSLVGQGKPQTWRLNIDGEAAINDVMQLSPDTLLLRLANTLYELNLKTSALSRWELPRQARYCGAVLNGGKGRYLISTENGVWVGTKGNWELVSTRGPQKSDPLYRLYSNNHGWFRSGRELADAAPIFDRYDSENNAFARFHAEGLPESMEVSALLEDREGNLWIGSPDGLFRLQRKSLNVLSKKNGLRSEDVRCIAVGRDGALWLGTGNGVSVVHNGAVTNLPEPRRLEYSAVGSLWPNSDESIWFASVQGLFQQWPNGERKLLGCPDTSDTCFIRSVFKDSSGRLWTSDGAAVWCYQDGQWQRFSAADGLESTDIRVFHEDREGTIWAGSYGKGLFRFNHGKFAGFKTPRSEMNNRAWWIHEDVEGIFWIASQDGLNRFEKSSGRYFTYTKQHGLFENIINNIQEDDFGQLWLSGLQGIYKVSRQELNEIAAGRKTHARCIAYGEAEGMLNRECNGGDNQPGGCKDSEGRIYFATARGIVMVDPREAPKDDVIPTAIVEDMKIDDRLVLGYGAEPGHAAKALHKGSGSTGAYFASGHFPPGAGNLVVNYTGISLAAPERLRFKYRLRGIDSDWVDAGIRRTAYYPFLPPDKYEFEVIAINSHGVASKPSIAVAFTLDPHFYQTRVFYIGCGVLAIGVIVLVQAYRLKWQRRLMQLEQQRALAQERTRIARDLHDDLGTALTGLALELDLAGKDAGSTHSLDSRLSQTADRTRDLAERMREVVWTVNPRCDTVSSLADFLEQQVTQFLQAPGISVRLDFPEVIPPLALGAEARHQLALSAREALTNVVRHSGATEVSVRLSIETEGVELEIEDNGRGFDPAHTEGNGLNNIRARMAHVGGTVELKSKIGNGAQLRFRIPLNGAPHPSGLG